ncbi:translocon-associated protein subunit beta [Pleuronectes platessa]|uniref:translocon-associated protein subunit beta n=2 Tax=Pleuronectidae TaxID=8256 RepID=UPI00232A629B|nr:translocon-associated protein subunit beta [Pleuronectes platessa]
MDHRVLSFTLPNIVSLGRGKNSPCPRKLTRAVATQDHLDLVNGKATLKLTSPKHKGRFTRRWLPSSFVGTRHPTAVHSVWACALSSFPHLRLEDKRTVRKMLHLIVVLALVSLVSSEEGARLLASKSLLNRYAVEGRDLTLQYNIYNVGSSVALEVELSDDSFPPEDFGIVSGMLNVKWDRIAPASNVSHTVVLRPLKAGYFNFTSASVSYLAQEGGQVVVGFTSAPGQGGILAQREFDRRFSPHYLDWAAFGVMTLPSIGIPLLLWYSSKRKYDSPKAKKN